MAQRTIDRHAVNRAKLVERLASICILFGWTHIDIATDAVKRDRLAHHHLGLDYDPSDTTWACLMIRLGGDI